MYMEKFILEDLKDPFNKQTRFLKIYPFSAGSIEFHSFSQYMAAIDPTHIPIKLLHEFYSFVKVRCKCMLN